MYLEKPLPSNEEAERCVIGGILLNNELMAECMDLKPTDFYVPLHKQVFRSMLELYNAGRKIDPITIAEQIKRRGQAVEDFGGVAAITNVTLYIPHFSSLAEYVAMVKDKARARRLIQICELTRDAALDETFDIDSVSDEHEQLLFDLRRSASGGSGSNGYYNIGDLAKESLERAAAFARDPKDGLVGISTGFRDLDARTSGLEKKDLIIVAGRPSMGKTALAFRIGYKNAEAGRHVLVFELEMSKEQMAQRLIATEAGIDLLRYRRGQLTREEWAKAAFVRDGALRTNMAIVDTPGLTAMEMRAKARQYYAEQKKLDLIIVDHLGLMGHPDPRRSEHHKFGDNSKWLKQMAKDFDVPVIALSQLSRGVEHRKPPRPMMSDLRESGNIEENADVIWLIYRPHYYHPEDVSLEGYAEIITGKNRNGPTGTDKLAFDAAFTRFSNYSWS